MSRYAWLCVNEGNDFFGLPATLRHSEFSPFSIFLLEFIKELTLLPTASDNLEFSHLGFVEEVAIQIYMI